MTKTYKCDADESYIKVMFRKRKHRDTDVRKYKVFC